MSTSSLCQPRCPWVPLRRSSRLPSLGPAPGPSSPVVTTKHPRQRPGPLRPLDSLLCRLVVSAPSTVSRVPPRAVGDSIVPSPCRCFHPPRDTGSRIPTGTPLTLRSPSCSWPLTRVILGPLQLERRPPKISSRPHPLNRRTAGLVFPGCPTICPVHKRQRPGLLEAGRTHGIWAVFDPVSEQIPQPLCLGSRSLLASGNQPQTPLRMSR